MKVPQTKALDKTKFKRITKLKAEPVIPKRCQIKTKINIMTDFVDQTVNVINYLL